MIFEEKDDQYHIELAEAMMKKSWDYMQVKVDQFLDPSKNPLSAAKLHKVLEDEMYRIIERARFIKEAKEKLNKS